MTRERIFTVLTELAAGVDDRIDPRSIVLDDTPMTAYGLTSMTMLQLFARLEDAFGISISDIEGLRCASPAAIVELVERKLGMLESRAS